MARRLVRSSLSCLLLMVVLAAGAVAWLAWFPDTLKPPLERLLTAQLGQQVRIDGPLRVEPGRVTTVELSGLHIAAPEWAAGRRSGGGRPPARRRRCLGLSARSHDPHHRARVDAPRVALERDARRAPAGPAAAAPGRRSGHTGRSRSGRWRSRTADSTSSMRSARSTWRPTSPPKPLQARGGTAAGRQRQGAGRSAAFGLRVGSAPAAGARRERRCRSTAASPWRRPASS